MTTTPQPAEPTAPPERAWQIATAVLAVMCLTLLVITFVLRARADQAVQSEQRAVDAMAELEQSNAELGSRNDTLLNQLSVSNERLAEVINELGLPASALKVSEAQIRRAVAAQQAAGNARERQAAEAQTARLCAAATLRALGEVHAGPDIESGSDEAVSTLTAALPACQKALG